MSMTYEQYGNGPWLVVIDDGSLHGSYRFATEKKAREFQRRNGGFLEFKPGDFLDLHQIAALRDRA